MSINWEKMASGALKAELKRRTITYSDLALLLQRIGIQETQASISNKISRGTFRASFLMQCWLAIEQFPSTSISQNTVLPFHHLEQNYKNHWDNPVYNNIQTNVKYLDINKSPMKKLSHNKVISLFTGAGGLDIGLEMAGFETVLCAEIDSDCRATLKYNRPKWKLLENNENDSISGDIRLISSKELLLKSGLQKGEAALVVGGAPCQPFSNIGKKQGIIDPNNGNLFLEFIRIVKSVEPIAFIFENVIGITQKKHYEVLKFMKDSFQGLGYGISNAILNSADYGVGQRRERFFLIGIRGIDNPAFPLPTHSKNKISWQKVISDLVPQPFSKPLPWVSLKTVLDGVTKYDTNRSDYAIMKISQKVKDRMKLVGPGQNFKSLPMEMRPNCWKTGKHQGHDTFGRMRLKEPSVTIRTAAYNPSKGMYIHPTDDRGFNSFELAAIQDFPIDWEFRCFNRKKVTLVSVGKQIGNAVPISLARSIGKALRNQLISIND